MNTLLKIKALIAGFHFHLSSTLAPQSPSMLLSLGLPSGYPSFCHRISHATKTSSNEYEPITEENSQWKPKSKLIIRVWLVEKHSCTLRD